MVQSMIRTPANMRRSRLFVFISLHTSFVLVRLHSQIQAKIAFFFWWSTTNSRLAS
ncbi:uncharacterized protein BDW43DRAFT_295124 [Aspergillus alliaceus]|uniref:uncharacterized protein n=1 Tax=Petromyces alliaceus TaxID=209559 RepID=UPI0012A3E723|nr:uncharacterized protein BDW43DRAFT_295124 [Aspergillus alliaceus]KAB8227028.1 hypothetical protein BDW43DRAFT_295124 [Aspergillus alliaceus]